jgi:hypothetical protein
MSLPPLSPNRIELAPGDDFVLRFKTWQDYENLLQQRGDLALPKIRHNAITQEIRLMSPLPRHGKSADLLADLVKLLLKHFDQDWEAFTPITLKQPQRQGIEPDYCFYVEHRTQILGKERLDLASDLPPDLAIPHYRCFSPSKQSSNLLVSIPLTLQVSGFHSTLHARVGMVKTLLMQFLDICFTECNLEHGKRSKSTQLAAKFIDANRQQYYGKGHQCQHMQPQHFQANPLE